jgi:hypothetical protein
VKNDQNTAMWLALAYGNDETDILYEYGGAQGVYAKS